MDVIRKTATQTTQIVQKKDIDTSDGPAMLWAAVRRWMEQIDPSYIHLVLIQLYIWSRVLFHKMPEPVKSRSSLRSLHSGH